jgi:hypothetical protein
MEEHEEGSFRILSDEAVLWFVLALAIIALFIPS